MRHLSASLILACVGLGSGALDATGATGAEQQDLLVQYHFVGAQRLAADSNAAKLREIWALPATQRVWDQTVQKLSAAPQQLFRQWIDPAQPDNSELFKLLFEDLRKSESFAEARSRTNQPPEWALAVRLDDARAEAWSTGLQTLLEAWKIGDLCECTVEGFKGWELKRQHPPGLFRFVRANSWCVIGIGQGQLAASQAMLRQIKDNDLPKTSDDQAWLSASLDLKWLLSWYRPAPALKRRPESPPFIELSITGKEEYLRSTVNFRYSKPQLWQLEPWQIATNTIFDPIVSFTAIQGIRPWLQRCEIVNQLGLSPLPNQACFWAQSYMPFQTFVAAPVRQATNLIERMAANLPSVITTNMAQLGLGEIRFQTNRTELMWSGLPIIVPFVRPAVEPAGEFLLGGIFPVQGSTNPLPAELFKQVIGRTNLLYYNWEITHERLPQATFLFQLFKLIANPIKPEAGIPPAPATTWAQSWLISVAPHLGNTITEITVKSPTVLSLLRNSHIGLNSLELVLLARWLDHPKFPLFDYQVPCSAEQSCSKQ